MTEFGESLKRPRYNFDLLNVPEDVFIEVAAGIGDADREELAGYRDIMLRKTPGLAKHAGAMVYILRETFEPWGPIAVEMVEGAMATGNLMTFELLNRVSEKTGIPLIEPDFDADHVIDTEPPRPRMDVAERVLDLSGRGQDLPTNYPVIFKAEMLMLAELSGLWPEAVQRMVFSDLEGGNTTHLSFAYFLMGAAEAVMPLERSAKARAAVDRS